MKQLIAIILMMFSMTVYAQSAQDARTVDISNMTPEQKAQMLKYAAEMTKPTQGPSAAVREEVSKWSELGLGMGKAAVAAAKEVGVAANEFVATPLGKITMAVVIYKIIGKDVLKFAMGSTIFSIFMTIAVFLTFRKKGQVRYENVPVWNGLWVKKKLVSYTPDSDIVIPYFLGAAVCAVVALIAATNAF